MTNYTAANLQTINNYTGLDNESIEAFMEAVISHINAETGASLPHFRDDIVNAAGSKVVSITDAQEPAFLAGAALMLRAYNEKGPIVGLGAMNVTVLSTDPHYKVWNKMLTQAINRLRGRSFERT